MGDKIFSSLWGGGLGPAASQGPEGLPAAAKAIIAQERAATEAGQAGETEQERIERQNRENWYDVWLRQGGGNGTRGKR